MPFLFIYVCDLLEELERPHLFDTIVLPKQQQCHVEKTVMRWFQRHSKDLGNWDTNSEAAKSLLRPDRLTDREYGLDAETLEMVIARALKLARGEYSRLQRWQKEPHLCDLGVCIGNVIGTLDGTAAPLKGNRVAVEEIDQCLLRIAAFNPNSSPAVQSLSRRWASTPREDTIDLLGGIYRRLQGREAKWLTRFILKDYGPVKIPDRVHPDASSAGLPNCLNVSIDLFSSSAPVPTYREGTMIIKGVGSTALARLQQDSPRASTPRPVAGGVSKSGGARGRRRASEVISPPPIARQTPKPAANINSRESSQESGPVIFQRGVLVPTKKTTIAACSSVDSPVSSGLGLLKPSKNIITATSSSNNTSVSSSLVKPNPQVPATPSLVDGPVTFQLGLLKPSSSVPVTRPPIEGPVSFTPSLLSSISQAAQSIPSIKSVERPGPPASTSTTSTNDDAERPQRIALGAISSNTSLRSQINSRPSQPSRSLGYRPTNPLLRAGLGSCQMTNSTCPLLHCIFLLSPCLTTTPHATAPLLNWHGVHYLRSLNSLTNPHLPQHCPVTRKIYRKIILVESHNRAETVNFLTQIKDLELQKRVKRGKRDGKGRKWDKEYVEVYDWRLLECIAKMDQGKELGYNAWKRCFLTVV